MNKDKTLYTEDSIISLDPREFTRLRPSTYLGSNEYSTQLVREIFSNALDEHIIGHGNEIIVKMTTDEANNTNTYQITDNGQGFPINVVRDDGKTVLEASFSVLNTSGKYDDNGVYQGSVVGLNGIGSKLTTYLSSWLHVISYDGKNYEAINFKDGLFVDRETGKCGNGTTGTTVTWSPDPQFFQNKEASIPDLRKLFEELSALCPELTIKFEVNGKTLTYHTENGVQALLDRKIGDKEILNNRFYIRKVVGTNLLDIAITYSSDYSDNVVAYVNYGLTESGVHIQAVKAAMTYQINKYAKDNNLLKKNDDTFTQAELAEGLNIVFNIKANNVKYDSQTKTRVVDLDKTLITTVMSNDFAIWLVNNPKDAKAIIDKALIARKARDAAQKAKDGIRNAGTKGKKFISLPTKLTDAWSKKRNECELFITEGDSAAAGLLAKRDGKTQAVFPIRGKILSCRKATPDKVYANAEISNIVKAIGLDIEKSTGKLIYDVKKLRYNRIVLASDSDSDGYQIAMLLINMFWWLCPELVTNGHIYKALPPLYRITTKKNEYIFLKDDNELNEYKKKHKNEQFILSHHKGLGEQSPDELAYCLLNYDTRNVQQITVDDAKVADDMLEMFMGNEVEPRRNYLLDHASEISVDIE